MADEDTGTSEAGSLVIVMCAPSGFYFSNDDPMPTMRFPSELGPIEFDVMTQRAIFPGFERPSRTGIWVELRGDAPSMGAAIEVYANFARGIAAVLSVAANAPVGDLTAEIMYDVTPGRTRRRYWRRLVPQWDPVPARGRKLPSELAVAVIRAWMGWLQSSVGDTDRLFRAFNQYHEALRHWEPGLEISAIGSLWIGMEALTPLKARMILASESITREELAAQYSVDEKHLDAEIRLRHFFLGDSENYQFARKARGGFQHAFDPLWKVRDNALKSRRKTADYLRSAILEIAGVDEISRAKLLSSPFNRPFHWSKLSSCTGG